jgi:two-component sensor histidine kinase
MLAHELRNPLAPIRNAAQLLNVHSSGKPEIEWARAVIERQTRHLARLVDGLLDVSRMVSGQIALQKKAVDLAEIVGHAVETSRPLIRLRKHHLSVVLPEQPVLLEADVTRLSQVLSNLLNNAAKYTEEGGQIRVDAAADSGVVTIRVRDTGLGIEPQLLPNIFDLFTQAERTPDRSEGGLGIGLTLVKRLVELHGGTVEALSEGLGSGAEFIVRLPALPKAGTQPVERPAPVRVPVVAAADARSLRILVVDDNVDAADSIAMLLNMEGHETRAVNTARAALLAVQPDTYPVVAPANPAESASTSAFAIVLENTNGLTGAIVDMRSKYANVPAGSYALDLRTRYYKLVAGAYQTRAGADSLLSQLRARKVLAVGFGGVVLLPYAFLVDTNVAAAEVGPRLARAAARAQPVYALRQAIGAVNFYFGAYENPQEASLAVPAARRAGLAPTLVYRTGRVF